MITIIILCTVIIVVFMAAIGDCIMRLRGKDMEITHLMQTRAAEKELLRKARVDREALLVSQDRLGQENEALEARIQKKDEAIALLKEELETARDPKTLWAMIYELQSQAQNSRALITLLENANTAYANQISELKDLHRATSESLARVAGDDK